MKDPTYGRIDPDIQALVDEMNPRTLGSRVAMENTLQARRDAGRHEDGPLRPPYAVDDIDTGDTSEPIPPEWWIEAAASRTSCDVGPYDDPHAAAPRDVRALLAGTVGGFVGLALAFGIGWAGYVWGWRR